MAYRTTAAEVKNIIDTDLSDSIVDSYIKSANLFVTNALGGRGLGTTTLADIERWIAAHFIACTQERMSEREKAGPAEVKYIGKYGADLNSTGYGQTAMLLDTTGTLRDSSKRQASITAITSFE